MITVNIPDKFIPERTYIIDTIFSVFLGLQYRIEIKNDINCYEIVLENNNSIVIKDHFFSRYEDGLDYLNITGIPKRINFTVNRFLSGDNIPVIYGNNEFTIGRNRVVCGIDIFASSFFMLTRWEEYANRTRDEHERFPSSASLAFKSEFLHRAVVNEYVEMLWNMLKHLECKQERKERSYRTFVTHDVDAPFYYASKGFSIALKQLGGDILERRDLILAFRNFYAWCRIKSGKIAMDPYNTFNYVMDTSEKHGLKSTFLFIADKSTPSDGDYNITNAAVRRLIRDIHSRGHEIGLHASYGSFNNRIQIMKELDILKSICSEEGVTQRHWGNRQHFLRWETPTTFDNLEHAGFDFDSTLSYADTAGFRCGVCYEYPVYNVLKRERLNLRERPLLVMECSIIDERYMNLGAGEKALSVVKSIKDTCKRFSGDFVLLWHNTRFLDRRERELYNEILMA